MTKQRRRFWQLAFGLAAAALLIGAGRVLWRCAGELEERLTAAAWERGVSIRLEGFRTGLIGVSADDLSVTLKAGALPVVLSFQNIEAVLKPVSLLVLAPEIRLTARLYEGSLEAQAAYSILKGRGSIRARAAGLQPARHPQLAALGISAGRIDAAGNIEGLGRSWEGLQLAGSANYAEITATQLTKPAPQELPTWITGRRQPLTIPAADIRRLQISAKLTGAEAVIDLIKLRSSLAKFSGAGLISWAGGRCRVQAQGRAVFSAEGARLWIELAPKSALQAEPARAYSWNYDSGRPRQPLQLE